MKLVIILLSTTIRLQSFYFKMSGGIRKFFQASTSNKRQKMLENDEYKNNEGESIKSAIAGSSKDMSSNVTPPESEMTKDVCVFETEISCPTEW